MLMPELRLRGGIRRSLLLCEGLAERGHTVAISCPGGPMLPWLTGSDAHENVELPALQRTGGRGPKHEMPRLASVRQPKPQFQFASIPWTARSPGSGASWIESRRLVREIENFQPDVIHVGSLMWPTPWWAVIRKTKATRVATVHGAADVRKIPRRQLNAFDVLIAVSRKVQEALINDAGQPIARVRHVGAGAPLRVSPHGPSAAKRSGISVNPVVACVDPLLEPWGPLALMQAIAKVREAGVGAIALIVGEGPASPVLRDWIRTHDAGEWVVLAEATYDPEGVMAAADVVVSCGGTLDSSQFAVEAMGRGVPALVAGLEGNYELVMDGETGLVFPPNDAAGLAEKLKLALTDQPLRAKLAQSGASIVADKLGLDAMVDDTLVAYDRGRGTAASQRLKAVTTSGRALTSTGFAPRTNSRRTGSS